MMEKDAQEHLDEALSTSEFRLGSYISEGIDIWKKKPLSFLAILLLLALISAIMNIIPVVGPMINSLFISSCIGIGIYRGAQILESEGDMDFETFFSGFDNIANVVILNLIIWACAMFLMIPLVLMLGVTNIDLLASGQIDGVDFSHVSASVFLILIPIIYAAMLMTYALPMLAFYDLTPWEALRNSARFAHKHWLSLFLFFVVIFFINILGVLALFVGIFVTMSMVYPMIYASFRDITDLDGYLRGDGDVFGSPTYTGATLDDFR